MEKVKLVYSENDTYTDRAYRKLKHICANRFQYKYGYVLGVNADAFNQMKKELLFIKQQGAAPLIIEIYEAFTAIEAKQNDFYLKGTAGASVVLYLMGISEIEPLGVRPKIYSEFFFGLDGEHKLNIEMWVMPKLYGRIVEYFDNYSGEARVRQKHFLNGKLHGINISDTLQSGRVDDSKEFNFRFSIISNPKSFKNNISRGKIFEEITPITLNERIKCMCWNAFDEGAWEGNGQELYRLGKTKLDNIIANREDVYEYLLAHNVDKRVAFGIAKDVMLGRIYDKGWDEEILAVLKNAQIPEWFINSCKKIRGLSSRVNAMSKLIHFRSYI